MSDCLLRNSCKSNRDTINDLRSQISLGRSFQYTNLWFYRVGKSGHLARNNSTEESGPARYLLPIRRMVLRRGLDLFPRL